MIGGWTNFFAASDGVADYVTKNFPGVVVHVALAVILIPLLIGFFLLLSRLDGESDSLDSYYRQPDDISKRHRFAGWLKWALPAIGVAMAIGFVIFGPAGIYIGAVYGVFNTGGTAHAIDTFSLGTRARRVLIGTCIAQLPIGILTMLADGL